MRVCDCVQDQRKSRQFARRRERGAARAEVGRASSRRGVGPPAEAHARRCEPRSTTCLVHGGGSSSECSPAGHHPPHAQSLGQRLPPIDSQSHFVGVALSACDPAMCLRVASMVFSTLCASMPPCSAVPSVLRTRGVHFLKGFLGRGRPGRETHDTLALVGAEIRLRA